MTVDQGTLPGMHHVAVVFANGADILVRDAKLEDTDLTRLTTLLHGLVALGRVATFAIAPPQLATGTEGMMDGLKERLGRAVVDVLLDEPATTSNKPAFLMPVWPFDHELGGMPASTGNFLGLDIELIATPSGDEEVGFHLPGRDGLWVVHARPLPTTVPFSSEAPTTVT